MSGETRKEQIEVLREQGFVIVRGWLDAGTRQALAELARSQLAAGDAPLEYEADLSYPGAPASRSAPGGTTVRRLLDAYARDPRFAAAGTDAALASWMRLYFGETPVMSRAHHNCVMTKHPAYGSLTGWHRDARYWSFGKPDLVSAWLALGPESVGNGGLWFVPGSHKLSFAADQYDEARFFRADVAANQALIATAVAPDLEPGDAVFFHCNTLHSAGKNLSDAVKFSLVFTYRGAGNLPLEGSRSASKPEIGL
jgi:phytanoyl-CoA hydroxylase